MEKKKRRQQILALSACLGMGLVFFLFLGQRGAVEFADSEGYIAYNIRSGVMPVYHFFLRIIRSLSNGNFLQNAVIIQGIFACITTVVFALYIYVRFELKEWEIVPIWLATLLPFATELPDHVATHVIFTESICYSLFYYYVMMANEVIISKKKTWVKCLGLFFVSVLLASTRSQLLLLLGISGCLYGYLVIRQRKNFKGFVVAIVLIIITCGIGIVLTYGTRNMYLMGIERQSVSVSSVSVEYVSTTDNQDIEENSDYTVSNEKNAANVAQDYGQQKGADQLALALLCRGFFEADEADVKYYNPGMEQVAFQKLYRMCDEAGILHNNAGHGLWAWYGYTNTDIYIFSDKAINDSMNETGWHDGSKPNATRDIANLQMKMAVTEILHHPLRFGYRTFRLMIPGFISCIFFNIRKIYLLCHLYVLGMYSFSIVLARKLIYGKENPEDMDLSKKQNVGRFMFFILFCCLAFVGTTNLVFYGMQRYFLYLMGVFYIGFYLCVRQSFFNRYVR